MIEAGDCAQLCAVSGITAISSMTAKRRTRSDTTPTAWDRTNFTSGFAPLHWYRSEELSRIVFMLVRSRIDPGNEFGNLTEHVMA